MLNPDTTAAALRLLSAVRSFDSLPHDTRVRLAAYARERAVIPGEMIVEEDEIGNEFYLVADGAFHVLGRGFDGSDLVLARLEAGSCFGEQALLSENLAPRTASVRALTRGRLLVLPRHALREACEMDTQLLASLRNTGESQKIERDTLFRDRILTDLGIACGYTIEHFAVGKYVFCEGEPGDKIYLIISGRALALRANGDTAQVLSELLPGQFFGELAILNDAPRAASVQAADDLEVAALDGTWFRTALQQHPRLRSIMTSLQSIYMLPGRGLVTLQSGGLASRPTITAVHHLPDGRRVLSIRFAETAAFRTQLIGADEATCSIRFSDSAAGIHRQIHLSDHRVVEIESEGPWQGLGLTFEHLLDGGIVNDDEIAAFEASGDLGKGTQPARDAAEIVCRCSGVTAAEIVSAIGKGCGSLEQIARENRATMVCGGCIPAVKEFLGQDEWRAATCESSLILAPDVRAFSLRTSSGASPALPGQHIVVQARIRGRWVERPYTIASAPSLNRCYELVVRRESKGLLSNWLFDQLHEGGALRLSDPRGTFCIGPGDERDIVFLAGGIGITPALAMARSVSAMPGSWALAIDHSVSIEEQGVYRQELESLSRGCPRIAFRLRVTVREGRISVSDIAMYLQQYPHATFLICGSHGYVAGVTTLAERCGVPVSRVQSERFIPWG